MTDNQQKSLWTVVLAIIASSLLAVGTNGFVGASLFFTIWAIAGLLETIG